MPRSRPTTLDDPRGPAGGGLLVMGALGRPRSDPHPDPEKRTSMPPRRPTPRTKLDTQPLEPRRPQPRGVRR